MKPHSQVIEESTYGKYPEMKCTYENCAIFKLLDEIGLDAFVAGIKEEKKRSAGLLTETASLVLFMQEKSK